MKRLGSVVNQPVNRHDFFLALISEQGRQVPHTIDERSRYVADI